MRRALVLIGVLGGVLAVVAVALAFAVVDLFDSSRLFDDGRGQVDGTDVAGMQATVQLALGLQQLLAPVATAALLAGMAILALLSVRFRLRRARAR
jgi:hypothetical protein